MQCSQSQCAPGPTFEEIILVTKFTCVDGYDIGLTFKYLKFLVVPHHCFPLHQTNHRFFLSWYFSRSLFGILIILWYPAPSEQLLFNMPTVLLSCAVVTLLVGGWVTSDRFLSGHSSLKSLTSFSPSVMSSCVISEQDTSLGETTVWEMLSIAYFSVCHIIIVTHEFVPLLYV